MYEDRRISDHEHGWVCNQRLLDIIGIVMCPRESRLYRKLAFIEKLHGLILFFHKKTRDNKWLSSQTADVWRRLSYEFLWVNRYFPLATRISNRTPSFGFPFSVMVIPVMARMSLVKNIPNPVCFPNPRRNIFSFSSFVTPTPLSVYTRTSPDLSSR